jgi:hypothetical protein
MECSLTSSADTWSCVISLRFDYDHSGRPLPSSQKQIFGPVIVNRREVEIWLRRAQAAILSPHLEPSYFEEMTAQELRDTIRADPKTLKFSKNVVCIDISDPFATDLSFVDLPGERSLLGTPYLTANCLCLSRPDPERSSRHHRPCQGPCGFIYWYEQLSPKYLGTAEP